MSSSLNLNHAQPLPPNPYNLNTEAPLHDAFSQCMVMEADADNDVEAHMLARCLGYLITELPREASESVANEVVDCNADFEKMADLAHLYINDLIRLFRQNKGHTPPPSEHPSRPWFETQSAFLSEAVEPAPRDHQAAKRSALKRDNYRCVVTGLADQVSYNGMDAASLQACNLQENPPFLTSTNFCHIFPPSTNWGFNSNDPVEKKKKYAGAVWAIINSFRSIDIFTQLDGDKIHSLENGFTMSMELHGMFDDLKLWFEHIEDHTYRLKTSGPRMYILSQLPANPLITFTSTDPNLPLPNCEYLQLHAAVCRVAHMSGATRYLDQEDRDFNSIGVLARDGSSANLLASRLRYVTLKA